MKRLKGFFTSLLALCLLCASAAALQIVQKPEDGEWLYVSEELRIAIHRRSDEENRVWYEAEVFASENEPLRTLITEGRRPGYRLMNPQKLAKEHKAVLAITDDFCGHRLQNNQRPGIVIRNGIVLGKKTRSSKNSRAWPNLDTLAVYADGSMKTQVSDAYKAEKYLEMGAQNVFAFGPVLVAEGQIPDFVLEEDYYPYNEPRMAIGMIEPYHYMIVSTEGRDRDSKGATPAWMARKMQELGCTEALNLDGGGTAVLMFMGEVLNRSARNMRSINSLIAFGTYEE